MVFHVKQKKLATNKIICMSLQISVEDPGTYKPGGVV